MAIGLGLGLHRNGLSQSFIPAALYGAADQGGVYDPSDFSTLWQDADGLIPVTSTAQPVSIMLDKRFNLRRDAELMPAISTASGLSTGVTVVGSSVRFTGAAVNAKADFTPNVTVSNVLFYEVYFTVSNYTSGTVRLRLYGTGESASIYPSGVTANGRYRAIIDCVPGGASNQLIRIEGIGASNSFDVSDVTIKELPGNHVWQVTPASRPTLQQDGNGRYYLQYDGVDDGLQSIALTGLSLSYPITVALAAKADADVGGGMFGVWGGSPPYFEIQKSSSVNRWVAFARGSVANQVNNETVGTNATPHVGIAEFTSSTVGLRVDRTDNSAATAQANPIGTLTDIRVGNGGIGFFNGKFYGGVIIFRTLTAQEIYKLETYLSQKAGITI